jgi:hypothetical protein
MKNVKFMLTSIAVIALVGGALAFKAQKFSSFCVYKKNVGLGTCPRIDLNKYNAWNGSNPSITSTSATTIVAVAGECPDEADFDKCTTTVTFQAE